MKRILSYIVSVKSMLGMIGILSVSVTVFAAPAHASSPHDGVIDRTPTLDISSSNGSCPRDITNTWEDLLYQASIGGSQFPYQDQVYLTDAYNQLQENKETGSGWGLWEMEYQGKKSVQLVIFPPDTEFSFEYAADGVTPVLSGYHSTSGPVYFVEMSMYSCNPLKYTVTGPSYLEVSNFSDHIEYQNFDNPSHIGYLVETKVFAIVSDNITYPGGYEGEDVPASNDWADVDGDGLTGYQESAQGTSNYNKDTDGDGLSDFEESALNPDRDDLFCGTSCAYPDPTQKDLYVEVDWMKDPATNESFKPTSTQLDQVESAYLAQGIYAHFDTGAYGGGNELSSYTSDLYFAPTSSHVDFYDYKNGSVTDGISSNFDHDRYHIWHYMISGYQYHDMTGSSGVSYAGDDDSFISYGLIEDNPFDFAYADFDDAIAGTVIHELGHDSCLSQTAAYTNQPSGCVYSGVDAAGPSTYASSMNYNLQMYIVDYSTGANGMSGDHDDWSAVNGGMGDFALSSQGAEMSGKKMTGRMRVGITLQKAKELRSRGQLGLIKKHGITRSLLPNRLKSPLVN